MKQFNKIFVGMDVHKESIDITLAEQGGELRRFGSVGGDRLSLLKAVRKLTSRGRALVFVYEAGPCGFWIYREITALGHACLVVSPSLIPQRAGDHVKTDRRDSENLARLARAGELTGVHVPDARDEAVRDLVRARDDAVIAQRRARQQLKALLLRNEIRYVGKTSWTPAHCRWLAELKLAQPAQQIAFQEYVDAITVATARIARFEQAMRAEVGIWRFAPAVAALQAMRGIQFVHAMTLVAELGDLTRFASARQLMAYLGLVPSEDSSGQRHRQGSITKAGNAYARRALVEAAWAYRHPARLTRIIALRQGTLPKQACDIAWKAQLRLCAKYRRLRARRVLETKIIVALARELSGFVWAIGQSVKPL